MSCSLCIIVIIGIGLAIFYTEYYKPNNNHIPREHFANQVVHNGAGNIAGPMIEINDPRLLNY